MRVVGQGGVGCRWVCECERGPLSSALFLFHLHSTPLVLEMSSIARTNDGALNELFRLIFLFVATCTLASVIIFNTRAALHSCQVEV